jgi:hypothetical protein
VPFSFAAQVSAEVGQNLPNFPKIPAVPDNSRPISNWVSRLRPRKARSAAVDPRDMVYLIRRDFESSRWVPFALSVMLALGLVLWLPALTAKRSIREAAGERGAVSILSDPFDSQKK